LIFRHIRDITPAGRRAARPRGTVYHVVVRFVVLVVAGAVVVASRQGRSSSSSPRGVHVSASNRQDQDPAPSPQPPSPSPPDAPPKRRPVGFSEDFKRFFMRGLAALLPTLITLSVLVYIWNFLWEYLGRHLIFAIKWLWLTLAQQGIAEPMPAGYIGRYWADDLFRTRLVGVLLAVVAVYIVGLLVGNLIGRTVWKIGEVLAMKIPVIRAIYPAVKQVTDFVLQERKPQFEASRVVAVQPHEKGIWSIGLVTGAGLAPLSETVGQEMVTVFVPQQPNGVQRLRAGRAARERGGPAHQCRRSDAAADQRRRALAGR
jgi:uncharacterized membrane protein